MVQSSAFSYRQLCGDNGLMVIVPHEMMKSTWQEPLFMVPEKRAFPLNAYLSQMATQNILRQYDFAKLFSHYPSWV